MSMGREWIEDHMYELYEYEYDIQGHIEDEARRGVWTTKDGQEIPVKEMTTSHIRNAIAYLERINTLDIYNPWIEAFKKELDKRAYEEYQDEVRKEYEYLHWDIR